jgi:hypothetical protein
MQIRVRNTGAVMYTDEFRQLHQGLGLPKVLTEEVINAWGGDIVFEGPQASGGTVYQFSMRQGVEQIEGKWYTNYILGPVFTDRAATENEPAKTAAEQEAEYKAMKDAEQAKNVRASRDAKLAECDWRVIKALESNQPQDFEWAAYRQALRDITSQAGFPWTIDWPVAP